MAVLPWLCSTLIARCQAKFVLPENQLLWTGHPSSKFPPNGAFRSVLPSGCLLSDSYYRVTMILGILSFSAAFGIKFSSIMYISGSWHSYMWKLVYLHSWLFLCIYRIQVCFDFFYIERYDKFWWDFNDIISWGVDVKTIKDRDRDILQYQLLQVVKISMNLLYLLLFNLISEPILSLKIKMVYTIIYYFSYWNLQDIKILTLICTPLLLHKNTKYSYLK